MRFILITFGLAVFSLSILFGVVGFGIYETGKDLTYQILNNQPEKVSQTLPVFRSWWRPVSVVANTLPFTKLKAVDELVTNLPKIIGMNSRRHYVVLFQNNMELRPTGGFMGSFAEVSFFGGGLESIKVQDIYVPDGQIKGYVKEPEPIKKYLFDDNHPGWRLRDANWNVDFPKATKAIDWFFNEGHIDKVDGYMAINIFPVVSVLRQIGGIKIPDYQMNITADNFYALTQSQVQTDFFPGSTMKRDFLHTVSLGLLNQITKHPETLYKATLPLIKEIENKHIYIYIPDSLPVYWPKTGWDGSIRISDSDYLMINEANLGINKANCCIERSLKAKIQINQDKVWHEIEIDIKNNNPNQPNSESNWGGYYKNYLRVLVPGSASNFIIQIDDQLLDPSRIDEEVIDDKKSLGFLATTEVLQTSRIKLSYNTPKDSKTYRLLFQKQSGIESWPLELNLTEGNRHKNINKLVVSDEIFSL